MHKIALFALPFISLIFAQFSPGELSKYHAHLEGNSNCVKCHELGKKELSDGCILCHSPIGEKIKSNSGYHKDKSKQCGECHSDHNGRNFELVYWPKDIANFNHDETGYLLTGKHRLTACRDCHKKSFVKESEILQWAEKNEKPDILNRTFLGLDEACLSCHKDVHQKELDNDCTKCHDTSDWKSASRGFDHKTTKFQLIGVHQSVECAKCHLPHEDWNPAISQFTGLKYGQCLDCHVDVHKQEVSNQCESCHNNNKWTDARLDFIHDKAKFPLKGSHIKLDCKKCHNPHEYWNPPVSQLTGLQFERCTPCHKDNHQGSYGPTCERCHTEVDWKKDLKPFDHSQTKYPLTGKHEKVNCTQCHEKNATQLPKFQLCSDCHADKHGGQFTIQSKLQDCAECHTVNRFKPTTYSLQMHQKSRFALDGSHLSIPCSQCHKPDLMIKGKKIVQFKWKFVVCNNCHDDVHRNQFSIHYQNDCSQCHNTVLFTQMSFNHGKTAFPLDGRHKNLACELCHQTALDISGKFIQYFPVAHQCSDCHTLTEEIK